MSIKQKVIVLAIINLAALVTAVTVPRLFGPSTIAAEAQVIAIGIWCFTLVLTSLCIKLYCDANQFDGFARLMNMVLLASIMTECVSWLMLIWAH